MKKSNLSLIATILVLVAPITAVFVVPGAATMLRRFSALSGEIPLFSILASLGVITIYLIFRLIYSSVNVRKRIEYSATSLLMHLLAQVIFIIALIGTLSAYKLITFGSLGTCIGILVVSSTVGHIVIDIPIYATGAHATLSKALALTRLEHIPGFVGSIITSLIFVLFIGIIIPTELYSAIIIAAVLFWEALYLTVAQTILSKALAQ